MRAAIMQPYFLPYPGYFQLIAAVDTFVVYDNIEYTKKGWINRNRLLRDGQAVTFSLPLKGASDFLGIGEREVAADFNPARLLNQFDGAYRKAPHREATLALLERIVRFEDRNLFRFLLHALQVVCACLQIPTRLVTSSTVGIDHSLRKQDKVIALCKAVGATTYVNAIGGVELYSRTGFAEQGLELKFIQSAPFEYDQGGTAFVPFLSIIDALMFNPLERVRAQVFDGYELI